MSRGFCGRRNPIEGFHVSKGERVEDGDWIFGGRIS